MFDVMLIDDEIDVCERLISMIDWVNLPLRLVAQAGDSDTARELYLLHKPKIIITDINIPIVSGLDLAEEFAMLDPELRFIVITGYNDFSFAQKAVKLGAVDLLLKPIFPDALNQSLEKAVDYFKTIREVKASMTSLKKLLNDNLPLIRETYLAELLHSGAPTDEDVCEKFKELGIECSGPFYTVAILGIRRDRHRNNFEAANLLLEITARALMSDMGLKHYTMFDSHFRINCIISTEKGDTDDFIEEVLGKLKSQMSFIADLQLYAGIGCSINLLAELNNSYNQALSAFKYQNILSDDTVIHYKNISYYESPLPTQQPVMDYLIGQFRLNSYDALESAVTQHFSTLYARENGLQYIREFTLEFIVSIASESSRQGIQTERVPAFSILLSELFSLNRPQDVLTRLLQLTQQFMALRLDRRSSSNNYLISCAKSYMQECLHDEKLCLDSVSRHIGLSRVYFCNLFHKEEGVSFSNYLKRIRVEKAKELLCSTNLKVFEISNAAGFSNAKYFGYVFKQIVGQTPLEFQKSPV